MTYINLGRYLLQNITALFANKTVCVQVLWTIEVSINTIAK